jgi:transposase
LYQKGWQQKRIAEALGVTKGAISQWIKKAKDLPPEQQAQALRVKKSPGRPPAISADAAQELVALIHEGAEHFGFVGDVWTAARVQALARQELKLHVSLWTINQFLHAQGFSVQKPKVVASQKNQKAMAGFRGGRQQMKKGHNALAPR